MMADKKHVNIQADSVGKTACPQCGLVVDVSDKEAFATANCPKCDAKFATPGVLGQFVLLKCLGAGGMGATFKAFEKSLGRHVAVKVLHAPGEGEGEKQVERFFSEARALASLDHPNVARAYSVGEAKGQPFLVMELIVGNALDQLLKLNAPLDEAMTLEIGAQMARALQAAAAIGLIHSDVKPANILVDAEGHAKLVDFGIARFGGGRITSDDALGTPYYLSPEQVRRQTLDFRTDIYSLGATLFHALAGSPPFEGKHTKDVLVARLKHAAPYLLAANPDLHAPSADVVARMLQADPDARYTDYDELIRDLDHAAAVARSGANTRPAPLAPHELDPPGFEDNRPHPSEAPHAGGEGEVKSKAPMLAAVIAVVLALAGVGIWAMSGDKGDGSPAAPPSPAAPVDPASLPQAQAPRFDPAPGRILQATVVTVSCPTEGAIIRYTVGRTQPPEPQADSTVFAGPITVQPGTFFRIKAFGEGYRPSKVVDGYYQETEVDLTGLEALGHEAGEALRVVQGLDPGQGFDKMVEQCVAMINRAERSYARNKAAEARTQWERLIVECKRVEGLAEARTAAGDVRKAAELARKGLGNPKGGGAALAAYEKDAKTARETFEAGDFMKAGELWTSSMTHIQAAGAEVVLQLKRDYEAHRAKYNIDELKKHGGTDWRKFEAEENKARESEKTSTPGEVARKYKTASDLLVRLEAKVKTTLAKAASDAAKRDAKMMVVRDEARKLVKAGKYRAAMGKAKAALAMKPSDGESTALVNEIEGKLKLTIALGGGAPPLTFVLIEPGKFTMGSPDSERDRDQKNEQQHEVELTKAFYMSTHEITKAQFAAFVEATRYRTMAENGDGADIYVKQGKDRDLSRQKDTSWRNCGFDQGPTHPVVCVSRLDVNKISSWLTGKAGMAGMAVRLPTETEWEYACRAGTKTPFSFGKDERQIKHYGNIADKKSGILLRSNLDDPHPVTAPVGSHKPNAWGLYDMHGNVAEWCLDGGVLYAKKDGVKDPRGSVGGPKCSVRGGGWDTRPGLCRSAARRSFETRYRSSGIGFRLVVVIK